jgi:hypothetical protein
MASMRERSKSSAPEVLAAIGMTDAVTVGLDTEGADAAGGSVRSRHAMKLDAATTTRAIWITARQIDDP